MNREGKLVGIVGRFDLIRAMASREPSASHDHAKEASPTRSRIMEWVDAHTGRNLHHRQAEAPAMPAPPSDDMHLTVTDFRHLVADHETLADEQRKAAARAGNEEAAATGSASWSTRTSRARGGGS